MLGNQVLGDDLVLETMLWELYQDFAIEMKLGEIFDIGMAVHAATAAGQSLPVLEEQRIVIVESTIAEDRFERAMLLSRNQIMTPAGPIQTPQGVLVSAGWKHYD